MEIKKFSILILILLFSNLPAFAQFGNETITITTYYPSPHGVYGVLTLYPRSSQPERENSRKGDLYYDDGTAGDPSRPEGVYVYNGSGWSLTNIGASGGGGPPPEVVPNGVYYNQSNNQLYAYNDSTGTFTPISPSSNGGCQLREIPCNLRTGRCDPVCSTCSYFRNETCMTGQIPIRYGEKLYDRCCVFSDISPKLVNGVHTQDDCLNSGGKLERVSNFSLLYFCRFQNSSCYRFLSGWKQYENYSSTVSQTCGDLLCPPTTQCTTGNHPWGNVPGIETCQYGKHVGSYACEFDTCSSYVVEVGCY